VIFFLPSMFLKYHTFIYFWSVVWENIFFGTKTTCFICRCIVLKDTKFVPFTYVYIQRHVRWWWKFLTPQSLEQLDLVLVLLVFLLKVNI
jgi:hypothetical protein